MSDAHSRLIPQAEAAKRLGVSVDTVRRLRIAGELAYVPGRPVRILESEIEAYIERKVQRRQQVIADAERDEKVAELMRMRRSIRRMYERLGPEEVKRLSAITKARMGR